MLSIYEKHDTVYAKRNIIGRKPTSLQSTSFATCRNIVHLCHKWQRCSRLARKDVDLWSNDVVPVAQMKKRTKRLLRSFFGWGWGICSARLVNRQVNSQRKVFAHFKQKMFCLLKYMYFRLLVNSFKKTSLQANIFSCYMTRLGGKRKVKEK